MKIKTKIFSSIILGSSVAIAVLFAYEYFMIKKQAYESEVRDFTYATMSIENVITTYEDELEKEFNILVYSVDGNENKLLRNIGSLQESNKRDVGSEIIRSFYYGKNNIFSYINIMDDNKDLLYRFNNGIEVNSAYVNNFNKLINGNSKDLDAVTPGNCSVQHWSDGIAHYNCKFKQSNSEPMSIYGYAQFGLIISKLTNMITSSQHDFSEFDISRGQGIFFVIRDLKSDRVVMKNIPDYILRNIVSDRDKNSQYVRNENTSKVFGGAMVEIYIPKSRYQVAIKELFRMLAILIALILLMSVIVAHLLSRYLAFPLKGLLKCVGDIKDGNYSASVVYQGNDEISKLASTMEEMRKGILERESRIKQNAELSALGVISSHVAHDMRSPLSMLKSYTNVKPSEMGEDFHEYQEAAKRSVNRLLTMADDLVDYSRAGKIKPSNIEVGQLISESTSHIVHDENRKKLLSVECNLDKSTTLHLDVHRMSRVIINLINNAIQAVETKGGKVELRIGSADDGALKIEIEDNGVGIDAEDVKHLFERFFTKGKIKGTGLGLSYCKQVVEAHGGTIEVESEAGRGTTFTVTVPNCIIEGLGVREQGLETAAIRNPKSEIEKGDLKFPKTEIELGANIMLVDDDPDMIGAWKRIIDKNGGSVQYTAYSADAVIKDNKLDTSKIDTAIVDYHYEGFKKTGIDLIKYLKANGIKTIHLCTAFSDNEEIQEFAKEAGATSVIPKPIVRLSALSDQPSA